MKQLTLKISAIAFLAFAASCGSSGTGGQLVGVNNSMNYKAPVPLGMVYVPTGVLIMGASDEDVRGRKSLSGKGSFYYRRIPDNYRPASYIRRSRHRHPQHIR